MLEKSVTIISRNTKIQGEKPYASNIVQLFQKQTVRTDRNLIMKDVRKSVLVSI